MGDNSFTGYFDAAQLQAQLHGVNGISSSSSLLQTPYTTTWTGPYATTTSPAMDFLESLDAEDLKNLRKILDSLKGIKKNYSIKGDEDVDQAIEDVVNALRA